MRPNCFCKIDKKLILAQPKINLRSSKNTLDYQEQWFEAFERKRGAPAWKPPKKTFSLIETEKKNCFVYFFSQSAA